MGHFDICFESLSRREKIAGNANFQFSSSAFTLLLRILNPHTIPQSRTRIPRSYTEKRQNNLNLSRLISFPFIWPTDIDVARRWCMAHVEPCLCNSNNNNSSGNKQLFVAIIKKRANFHTQPVGAACRRVLVLLSLRPHIGTNYGSL